MPLHARLEVRDFVRRVGMLQVVKRAAVGDGGNHGAQLQRRHGNAFSEGAHLADAAELGRNLLLRVGAEVFASKCCIRPVHPIRTGGRRS